MRVSVTARVSLPLQLAGSVLGAQGGAEMAKKGRGNIANFKGKKAAPFAKAPKSSKKAVTRKPSSTKTAKGKKKKGK